MKDLGVWGGRGPYGSAIGSRRIRATPYRTRGGPGGLARLALEAAGVAGFIGFLAGAHYFPQAAAPLRLAALGWFAIFGVLYVARSWRR